MQPELAGRASKSAERRLVQMLMEADVFREQLAGEIREGELYRGLETEKILVALLTACAAGVRPDVPIMSSELDDKDRRLLNEIAFETLPEATWEEAEDCLRVLRVAQLLPQLRALKEQHLQGMPHEQFLALQAKIQELQGKIAQLEGKFGQN
jgi:hypothetical protein